MALRTPFARRSGRATLLVGLRCNLARVQLAQRAGFSPTSGTIIRALHGIKTGSPSGSPYQGLLDRGLVKDVELDGLKKAYQITPDGLKAIEGLRELPKLKEKPSCTNYRYLLGGELGEDFDDIDAQQNVDQTTKQALRNAQPPTAIAGVAEDVPRESPAFASK